MAVQFADAKFVAVVHFAFFARKTSKKLIVTSLPLLLAKTAQLFFRCFEFHRSPNTAVGKTGQGRKAKAAQMRSDFYECTL